MKKDIIVIFWKDAAIHGSAQVSEDDVKTYGIMAGVSCGIFVHEDKEQITIATDYWPKGTQNEKNSYRNLSSIPKSGIQQVIHKTIESKRFPTPKK